jgi:hypothetical protein
MEKDMDMEKFCGHKVVHMLDFGETIKYKAKEF